MAMLWPLFFISFLFIVVLNTNFDPTEPLFKFMENVLEKATKKLEKLDEKLKKFTEQLDEKQKAKMDSDKK